MRSLLSALLAVIWLGASAVSVASPEDDFREANKRLSDEFDGMDAEQEATSPTVKAFWEAVDALLSARGVQGLAAETKSDQFFAIKIQKLSDDVFAVSVSSDQLGHLAILDHGKVRWSSTADLTAPGCWRGAPERPCSGTEIGPLPAEGDGAPRFYVVADYAQVAGGTRGHQLSLWYWKGGKAFAFFIHDFVTGGDAPQGVTVTGNEVKLTGKGFWAYLSVCGSCEGRQRTQRFQIGPNGVKDLGMASLTPELDAVDTLLGRLAEKRPTADIAAPEAAVQLEKSWHGRIFVIDPPRIGDHAVCLAPEDLPALTFRFAPDSKAMRITAIEPGPCG